jgi:hypothetical protein
MSQSITPPPELVQQWWDDFNGAFYEFEAITAKVFQAGADQELEACCEWLSVPCPSYGRELRNARRPKPPSLKEKALVELVYAYNGDKIDDATYDIISRALEALPDD